MSKFTVEFGTDGLPPAMNDGRLDAPAFHRNHDAIWAAIAGFLDGKTGDALELGSGTGQHVVAFARQAPQLTWWPSDMMASHLASIAAYQRAAGLDNLRAPQFIDLTDTGWSWQRNGHGNEQAKGQGDATTDALTAMVCINVIHIAPWRVAQNLMAGAGRLLRRGGYLFLYGPYKRNGQHSAPSNEAFDASLRARNPDWGVRDLDDVTALANGNGLTLVKIIDMPANNLVLAFERG